MKIAVIGTYWPNYSRNRALIDGLISQGVHVEEFNYQVEKEKMEQPGDLSFKVALQRVSHKLKSSLYILRLLPRLKSFQALVVLYPGHLDLVATWIVSKFLRKPLLFDAGISLYDVTVIDKAIVDKAKPFANFIKVIESWLLKLPNQLFVDTELMKTFISRNLDVPKRKIFVIPLSANDKMYTKASANKTRSSSIEVFFFGLYNPLQGARYIAEAARLLKNDPHIHVTMLGNGPDRQEVEEIIKFHGLTNISLIDFVPEAELVKYIHQADIILGIFADSNIAKRVVPNKVFAGLACGKPVITAWHPAIESFFTDKYHLYGCKPENPVSLARAIRKLSQDKSLRNQLSNQGYELFISQLSPDAIGALFINQLNKLV